MANSGTAGIRTYGVGKLGLTAANATTGAWLLGLSSGQWTLSKAAAATTTVLTVPIPTDFPKPGTEDSKIKTIKFAYTVGVAAITTAPSVVLSTQVFATTGALTDSTIANTLTFLGSDAATNGKTVASHVGIVTIDTPAAITNLTDLILTITIGEASTTTLQFNGLIIDYTG